jgi:16S rRNA (cytosine967-C5)-methyltransferase
MSVIPNQQRTFLRLLGELRPYWRTDQNLPARIQQLLARERSFGSRDRRLYRELIYCTIRYLPWIEPWLDRDPAEAIRRVAWLAADLPATSRYRAETAIGAPPEGDKSELLPAWFREHCAEVFTPAELDAQLRRAPLWLRLQTEDVASVAAEFASRGWRWEAAKPLATALQVFGEPDVTQSESYRRGAVEIQDLGSQLLLQSADIEPGGRWLDACAGAGGKTLQLARLLGPDGRIDAHDIRPAALRELHERTKRGGIRTVSILDHFPSGEYDGALVDAPCSGSGTWRRAPHLKWTTTAAKIREMATRQSELLDQFGACVRAGGRLIYATCSLSRWENEDVVESFLARNREFSIEPPTQTFGATAQRIGLTILPALHDTDGFFVAQFRRRSGGSQATE